MTVVQQQKHHCLHHAHLGFLALSSMDTSVHRIGIILLSSEEDTAVCKVCAKIGAFVWTSVQMDSQLKCSMAVRDRSLMMELWLSEHKTLISFLIAFPIQTAASFIIPDRRSTRISKISLLLRVSDFPTFFAEPLSW